MVNGLAGVVNTAEKLKKHQESLTGRFIYICREPPHHPSWTMTSKQSMSLLDNLKFIGGIRAIRNVYIVRPISVRRYIRKKKDLASSIKKV